MAEKGESEGKETSSWAMNEGSLHGEDIFR